MYIYIYICVYIHIYIFVCFSDSSSTTAAALEAAVTHTHTHTLFSLECNSHTHTQTAARLQPRVQQHAAFPKVSLLLNVLHSKAMLTEHTATHCNTLQHTATPRLVHTRQLATEFYVGNHYAADVKKVLTAAAAAISAASISRHFKIIGLFCRVSSLL